MNINELNRIEFREVESTDFDIVLKWENDPKNWLQSGVERPYTSGEIRAYVKVKQSLLIHGQTRRIIVLKDSRQIVGAVDLFKYDSTTKTANLGILIEEEFRRKGYATEAIRKMEKFATNELKLTCIECQVLESNPGSQKLFEAIGYQKIKSEVDSYFYLGDYYPMLTYRKKLKDV